MKIAGPLWRFRQMPMEGNLRTDGINEEETKSEQFINRFPAEATRGGGSVE
jgi:hypothetical protein